METTAAAAAAAAATTTPEQYPPTATATTPGVPKIVLLGDSLTQLSFEGWGATLAHVYQRRADVLNRGYSGYNTNHYLQQRILSNVLRNDMQHQVVALVVIWFGANDAALPNVDPHHHVPLDEYTKNLETTVWQIRQVHPKAKILLVTPPPVHGPQRLQYQRQRYGDRATGVLERTLDVTSKYALQCKTVANKLQVPVVDMFQLMLHEGRRRRSGGDDDNDDNDTDDDQWASFFSDGLHFAPAGHAFVAQKLLEAIDQHFPSLTITPDPVTGQYCNSGSKCLDLGSNGPYHDTIIDDAITTVVDANTMPCEKERC